MPCQRPFLGKNLRQTLKKAKEHGFIYHHPIQKKDGQALPGIF
jgi:hypothetical protein